MTYAAQMLETSPQEPLFARDALARCLAACFDCAQACQACADACLAEDHVEDLTRCISLDTLCADLCLTTGSALSRQHAADKQLVSALVEVCAKACLRCAEECDRHAEMHEHCRICAEACRACEASCRELLAS